MLRGFLRGEERERFQYRGDRMISKEEAKRRIGGVPGNRWHEVLGTPYLTVKGMMDEGIRYGFSTRLGGVSQGIFAEMNLGLKLGDDAASVLENYRRICRALGMRADRISCPDQVHKTRVRCVLQRDAGAGIVRPLPEEGLRTDAQITNISGLPLIVYGADCVPILFYDPVGKVIGSAHAGWRGTVAGISIETVRKMQEAYGTNPANVWAVIGPSAGPESYEVDCRVADEARKSVERMEGEESLLLQIIRPTGEGKYLVNLWELNRRMLMYAGVPEEHICVSGLDTIRMSEIFHSHRATGGRRGLNAGLIMMI